MMQGETFWYSPCKLDAKKWDMRSFLAHSCVLLKIFENKFESVQLQLVDIW